MRQFEKGQTPDLLTSQSLRGDYLQFKWELLHWDIWRLVPLGGAVYTLDTLL